MLSVTDEMLPDASWLLMQGDVKTVNIPAGGRCEHREKNERGRGAKVLQVWSKLVFLNMKYRQCLLAKILTEAVGRCPQQPVKVLPVVVLEHWIQVVRVSPPSLSACSTVELRLQSLF